jgi:hypothetical protein
MSLQIFFSTLNAGKHSTTDNKTKGSNQANTTGQEMGNGTENHIKT